MTNRAAALLVIRCKHCTAREALVLTGRGRVLAVYFDPAHDLWRCECRPYPVHPARPCAHVRAAIVADPDFEFRGDMP
jgi:hypothetical protein